ncbi:MAG: AAA family ATPase [Pseudomonadota bacterium]
MPDTNDAAEVISFLTDPANHGDPPGGVSRIDTHGAVIVLAGNRAYKLKRRVAYDFMDFSTLEKREHACRREIELNRRTAPDLYLGLKRIIRNAKGALDFAPEDNDRAIDTIDWVVEMHRFDPAATLDIIASRHGLPEDFAARIAPHLLKLFRDAQSAYPPDETRRMRAVSDGNVADLSHPPHLIPEGRLAAYRTLVTNALERNRALIDRRVANGFVRRGHGDLHLGNIARIGGDLVIFDALEFDEDLATVDILYDIAFLLMDLWTRGEGQHANDLLGLICAERQYDSDLDGLALLPIHLSMRAAVRAKVAHLTSGHLDGDDKARKEHEARWFFQAAEDFIAPTAPHLIAVGGLSGSGKSTVARTLAPDIGTAPGALHLRSDIERKRLAGVAPTDRLPPGSYTPEASALVYDWLMGLAARVLASGHSVVVDAVFAREQERHAIADVAERCGVAFQGLWLTAPADVLIARANDRTGDASDATGDIVRRQLSYDLGTIDWAIIDAAGTTTETLGEARRLVSQLHDKGAEG